MIESLNSGFDSGYMTPWGFSALLESKSIPLTDSGLYNIAGLFGSVHNFASWRNNPAFIAGLGDRIGRIFNPQTPPDQWDDSYAEREAQVMAGSRIIVFRLENWLRDEGSLGSMAEIGMAVATSLFSGQQVIVSIEKDFPATLRSTSARAQFAVLDSMLRSIAKSKKYGSVTIHDGDDLGKLAELIVAGFESEITETPILPISEVDRVPNMGTVFRSPTVTFAGSSQAYSPSLGFDFEEKRQAVYELFNSPHFYTQILSRGSLKAAWNDAWAMRDPEKQLDEFRLLFDAELGLKKNADILILPIQNEALSKAAVTETGFLLANALLTGQKVFVLLEPFNALNFLFNTLSALDILPETLNDFRLFTKYLINELGLHSELIQDESDAVALLESALTLVRRIRSGDTKKITPEEISNSMLSRLPLWKDAVDTQRIRMLVGKHMKEFMKKLSVTGREGGVFYTDDYPTFVNALNQLSLTVQMHQPPIR